MPGQLEINGVPIPIASAPSVYDPSGTPWQEPEGSIDYTHGGYANTLALSAIELHWPLLPQEHASALLDYYYDVIVPAGKRCSSLKIPPKVAMETGGWSVWKLYNQFDDRGIQVDEPTWTPDGVVYRDFRWRFHNVCHADER